MSRESVARAITDTICLLLTTGLYIHAFEDWDQLAETAKTWIELRRLIQEAFQRRLNATAPTAGHQGYAPALPFQHNAFDALAGNDSDEDDSTETVATQMPALTFQSQLTATTATNSSQQMGQYIQTLAHQQDLLHRNQHQMMEQMAALSFNQSDAGRGIGCQGCQPQPPAPFTPNGLARGGQFAPNVFGRGGGQGQGRGRGCGRGPPPGFNTGGRGPPIMLVTTGRTPGYMGPPTIGGRYFATPPQAQHVQPPPYSNLTKRFANWNECYSCGFDVPDGHTSQTCPHHLRKPDHDIHFTRQNAQQYIDQG